MTDAPGTTTGANTPTPTLIPTAIAPSSLPIQGLASWIASPLPQVGSTTASLLGVPVGTDTAASVGCKSQTFTSWDLLSRSYVASYCVSSVGGGAGSSRRRLTVLRKEICPAEAPTSDEMSKWDNIKKKRYLANKTTFYKATGPVTKEQLRRTKTIQMIRSDCARRRFPLRDYFEEHEPENDPPEGGGSVATSRQDIKVPPVEEIVEVHHANSDNDEDPDAPSTSEGLQPRRATRSATKSMSNKSSSSTKKSAQSSEKVKRSLFQIDLSDLTIHDSDKPAVKKKVPHGSLATLLNRYSCIHTLGADQGLESGDEDRSPGDSDKKSSKDSIQVDSPSVPVYVVGSTSMTTVQEEGHARAYSTFYNHIVAKLTDPASQSALGAITKGVGTRDAGGILSLAKFLLKSSSTIKEVTPIVRLGCMAMSTSVRAYEKETIYYRFLRGWTRGSTDNMGIDIIRPIVPTESRIIAMPLDVFVALCNNKYTHNVPMFAASGCDVTWTAVPVRNEILNRRWIIPYIASFLTSELWNGTTNFRILGEYSDSEKMNKRKLGYRVMPAANSVSIPGPRNVILVLADNSTVYTQPRCIVNGTNINVWTGEVNLPEHQSFARMFYDWWNTENAYNIPTDCSAAHHEINTKICTGNSCDLGMSLVAELYTRGYQGLRVPVNPERVSEHDWSEPLGGAWRLERGPLAASSRALCDGIPLKDEEEIASARRKLLGYSFSAVSSWSRPPSGIAKTRTSELTDLSDGCGKAVVWETTSPTHASEGYVVSTVESPMRVAIYMKLAVTHERPMSFGGGEGMVSWTHMLGMALAAQATLLFSETNLDLGVWSGYKDRSGSIWHGAVMDEAVSRGTNGVARYFNYKEVMGGWDGWDPDVIEEYYGVDPYLDIDWMSHGVCPSYYVNQWVKKMSMGAGVIPEEMTNLLYKGEVYLSICLNEKALDYRWRVASTIDADRYLPSILVRPTESPLVPLSTWVDQFSYVSLTASGSSAVAGKNYLCSQTLLFPGVDNTLGFVPPLPMYVLDSHYGLRDQNQVEMRTGDLRYPDPVPLDDILRGAKNYLIAPGLAGATDFVTGGLPGAVVGAGSALLSQMTTDIARAESSRENAALQEQINALQAMLANSARMNPGPISREQIESAGIPAPQLAQNILSTPPQLYKEHFTQVVPPATTEQVGNLSE